MDIATDIWLVIMMFYSYYIAFEGNTINLTMSEKEMITSWFIDIFGLKDDKKSAILTSKLLYDYKKTHKHLKGGTRNVMII